MILFIIPICTCSVGGTGSTLLFQFDKFVEKRNKLSVPAFCQEFPFNTDPKSCISWRGCIYTLKNVMSNLSRLWRTHLDQGNGLLFTGLFKLLAQRTTVENRWQRKTTVCTRRFGLFVLEIKSHRFRFCIHQNKESKCQTLPECGALLIKYDVLYCLTAWLAHNFRHQLSSAERTVERKKTDTVLFWFWIDRKSNEDGDGQKSDSLTLIK